MNILIQYLVTNDRGGVVAEGKIRVKNCDSEGHALNKLRAHMNEKYWDLHKLQMWVLEDTVKTPEPPAFDYLSTFKDIFK